MKKINWGRLVLGGAVAGVVLILLAAASAMFFMGRQGLLTAMNGLRPSTSSIAGPIFFLCAFLLMGILMIWWYAAIRPLLGPGPKTAAVAGLAIWVTVIGLGLVGFACQGIAMGRPYPLPPGPALPLAYLLIMVTSTIAGASVYKEQQS